MPFHFLSRLQITRKATWLAALGGLLTLIPLALAFQYQAALPGYQYHFPKDHASHPAFKTEWWYYTGHLNTQTGRRFGYELTFFRIGNDAKAPRNPDKVWSTDNLYAAHFALSDESGKQFHYSEKLNRSGLNVAGARPDAYWVWNELWLAEGLGDRMILRANSPDGNGEIHLMLHSTKPPVIHGKNGVSQKAGCVGCASHYYSLTSMDTEGLLVWEGKALPVRGLSWMDHEFGSNQLGKNQVGWDWFSVQLTDNTELMLYLLRREDGTVEPNSSGTVVYPDGRSRHLALSDFEVKASGKTWTSPASKGKYPLGWNIRIPSEKLTLTITPAFENQELFTAGSTGVAYWEGSSKAQGQKAGKNVTGQAYVELTGYASQSVKGKL